MSENEMKMPKIKLVNIVKHFCTITRHRLLVCKHCFKIGLYWQGLTHDLSKVQSGRVLDRSPLLPGGPEP